MRFLKRTFIGAILFQIGIVQSAIASPPKYALDFANDFTLTLTAAGMAGFGTFLYYRMETPDSFREKNELLPWDRPFAGRYSETADRMSDYGSALAIAPFAIGGIALYSGNSNGKEFATFTLMLLQSIGISNGINLTLRSFEIWPRPYIYAESGDGRDLADNAKSEAYGSFFSGHATAAFCIATFTDQWFRTAYSGSPYTSIVRATAYSLAGFESVLRVAAGKHYPSDVIVGALVGTGVSLGVLELHKNRNKRYSLWAFPNMVGITLFY